LNLVPYLDLQWGYRGEGGGVDCWMLVRRVARELFGREYPDYPVPYERIGETFAAERVHWIKVDREHMEPGDVVLLTMSDEPFHAGIMVDRDRFLHIPRDRWSRVERIDSFVWSRRADGFYRCPT
jgi:cell wall-associated NlpC family hydrolase